MAQIGSLSFNNPQANKPVAPGPSLQHNAGQAFGHFLNALPGYSTLGSQITNPEVNYKGDYNPGYAPPVTGHVQSAIKRVDENPITSANSAGAGANDAEAQLARYSLENQLGQLTGSLGGIDGKLNTAIGNVNNDYQSAYDTLTGQRQVAQRDYTTNRDNQIQDYTTARDNVNSQTRQLLNGARRLLGSQGAGGGSADLYGAPLAANTEGANQNAVVKQTNDRNLVALDTANGDNERQFDNSFGSLARQRDNGINDARTQIESQRADILNNIGAIQGQKAIINGGNYQSALAASAPFASRVQSILSTIDGLAARPTGITAQPINLAKPDLAQYGMGRFDAPTVARQDPTLSPTAYQTLIGTPDDQRKQLGY